MSGQLYSTKFYIISISLKSLIEQWNIEVLGIKMEYIRKKLNKNGVMSDALPEN